MRKFTRAAVLAAVAAGGAAEGDAENLIGWAIPEAGGEGQGRSEQPREQKSDAGDMRGDGPTFAQETLHRLAEGMGSAEIAMRRATEVAGVKAEDVVFAGARLVHGAHALSAQAGVEFVFVSVEARSHADQRG